MRKLTAIAVFILLGTFANTAMPAKPVKPETITLTAGPLSSAYCNVANHTDTALVAEINYCFGPKDNSAPSQCFYLSPLSGVIEPGYYQPNTALAPDSSNLYTCEITYTGVPGDITGVLCGSTGTGTSATIACLPLQTQ